MKQKVKKTKEKIKEPRGKSLKIQPTGDRVLIKESLEDVREKTASGIIIPATAEKDSGAKRGRVVAAGPGKHEDGKLVPVSVKIGDTVLFQWGEKVVIDSEEYYLVRDSEIMAIVK